MLRSRLATLSALLVLAPPAFADFTVAPVLIEKSISPSDHGIDFVISNSGDQPLRVTLSTAPLRHDRSGKPIEGKAGDPYDASGLIHLDQTTVILGPLRWKRIRARVDVPSRPGGGYAFIYARSEPASVPAGSVMNALRVGVVVELSFPNHGKTGVAVEDVSTADGHLKVAVRNDGETHVKPSGLLRLIDGQGKVAWQGKLPGANVFPGMVRELPVDGAIPSLTDGQYTVSVELTSPSAVLTRRTALADRGQLRVQPGTQLSAR